MEMSCDEAVIRQLGYDVRKEYSQALLSLSCGKMKLGGCPIAFGEGAVKNRVLNILAYHKKAVATIALMVILICATVIGLTGGVSELKSTNSAGQATVRYTFADGSDVLIPMCDANFDGMTATGSDEDLEDASFTNTQVWLPDLKVWNVKTL